MRHNNNRHNNNRRNNRGGFNNNNQRRGPVSLRQQNFDSNGPDVRIRGTAWQVSEKYLALAKDASVSGDHILAESYLQHAEHYQRLINEYNEQMGITAQTGEDGQPTLNENGEPVMADMASAEDGNASSGDGEQAQPQQQFRDGQNGNNQNRSRHPYQQRNNRDNRDNRDRGERGDRNYNNNRGDRNDGAAPNADGGAETVVSEGEALRRAARPNLPEGDDLGLPQNLFRKDKQADSDGNAPLPDVANG